ncbi:MAG: hypothetical protein U9R26_06445 [Campylobacterota bacterium]|nr:hypothetical protein [Campylobacterota bacterium]
MKEQLGKYQDRHLDGMLKKMTEHHYRFRRYNSIFTAVLFYGAGSLNHKEITKTIRTTDRCFRFEENLFLIIFGETGSEGGIIAAEKLLPKLLHNPDQKVYVSAVECSKDKEGTLLVHQLFNILEFAIEHKHINEVVDSSYFDGLY